MLKDLYQSFVIAKAAAAANFTIQNLNKRQSEDVGINPESEVVLLFRTGLRLS